MKHVTDDIHQSVLGAKCWNQSSSLKNVVQREKHLRFCMRVTLLSVLPWSTVTGCSSTPPYCTQRACSHYGSALNLNILHHLIFDWRVGKSSKTLDISLVLLIYLLYKRVITIEIKDFI